jgi:hypothetical protein
MPRRWRVRPFASDDHRRSPRRDQADLEKLMEDPGYHAYLVRVWRDDETTPWRASIEDAHTGESRGFASLEALFAFMRSQAAAVDSGRSRPGP